MKRIALVLLLLVACSHATPPPPPPQDTQLQMPGLIRGTVIAKDGSVLPGVMVILDGRATTVTDAQGAFRFLSVPPGKHTVLALLAGYGQGTRIVTISASSGLQTSVVLNPSVSESIVVTAEAPLLDVRKSGSTTTISMADPPPARDPWVVRQAAPAVQVDRINVGGNPNRVAVPAPVPPPQPKTASYAPIVEHAWTEAAKERVTTFSIDVDGASYANVRRFLNANQQPPADAVRIEEMINYFSYHYPEPADGRPVAMATEVVGCPWAPEHRLLRIGLRGKTVAQWRLAPNNLVFLLDVSGSMSPPDRLALVQQALRFLVNQLRGDDSVSIVVYAGAAGVVLPKTSAANKDVILAALDKLHAGGSTAGGAGIELAYKVAEENFLPNGNNRVILATDGDFNVGISSMEELKKLIESKRRHGLYLTCIGVGTDNLKDATMEMLAGKGNGNYYYLDSFEEAKKVFRRELTSTLVAVADDVKVQLEFDPAAVKAYRQLGYEDRAMANADFADDSKDAGEIGSAQSVTALYEVVPNAGASRGQIATLRLRYKDPGAAASKELTAAIADDGKSAYEASPDTQFAAAVAEMGLLLRNSPHKGKASWADVAALARAMRGEDLDNTRGELLRLVEVSRAIVREPMVALGAASR
ncbi:MAG TPA: von Willebrand factor type A domain-containing protein [Thermoanaerobaculia bacterium]|nr:von Willebrand factor type A domain-containing protein [Thermoanaerobaculia bacterium]